MRLTTSWALPGANGTIAWMFRLGHVSADSASDTVSASISPSTPHVGRMVENFITISSFYLALVEPAVCLIGISKDWIWPAQTKA
jgi:hypothetical protein